MEIKAMEHPMKDGRTAIIRNATTADAAQILAVAQRTARETRNLGSTPEEYNFTIEAEEKWINAQNVDHALLQVAEVDGKIVGDCILHPLYNRTRMKHRCGIGIALLRDVWGNGLGTRMYQTAIAAAKEIGYEQMELEVVSTNERAIRLYEKMGFVTYGKLPKAFKYEDGTYAELTLMVLDLR